MECKVLSSSSHRNYFKTPQPMDHYIIIFLSWLIIAFKCVSEIYFWIIIFQSSPTMTVAGLLLTALQWLSQACITVVIKLLQMINIHWLPTICPQNHMCSASFPESQPQRQCFPQQDSQLKMQGSPSKVSLKHQSQTGLSGHKRTAHRHGLLSFFFN